MGHTAFSIQLHSFGLTAQPPTRSTNPGSYRVGAKHNIAFKSGAAFLPPKYSLSGTVMQQMIHQFSSSPRGPLIIVESPAAAAMKRGGVVKSTADVRERITEFRHATDERTNESRR